MSFIQYKFVGVDDLIVTVPYFIFFLKGSLSDIAALLLGPRKRLGCGGRHRSVER